MYMIIEVDDDNAGIASQMFGKDVNVIHAPDIRQTIYSGKVVHLSMDWPGEVD